MQQEQLHRAERASPVFPRQNGQYFWNPIGRACCALLLGGLLLCSLSGCMKASAPQHDTTISGNGGVHINVQQVEEINWSVVSKVIAGSLVVIIYIVVTFVIWNRRLAAEIDERKAAEQALLASQQRLELAIRGGELGFWDVDMVTGASVFNDRWAEIIGYSLSEVEQTRETYVQSIYEEDREWVLQAGEDYRQGKRSDFDVEYRVQTKQGRIRWVSSKGAIVERNESGEPLRMVGMVIDVTDRKRAEAEIIEARDEAVKARRSADEANDAKGYFLANMSHEIRTPMNAIMGMAYLAEQTDLSLNQSRYISKISSAAKALLRIINDILDFSKIEAGKLQMESVAFNLQDVLDSVGDLISARAHDKKDLEVLFATTPDVPMSLVGDPLRLGQVLTNLAGNAVKFTDSGEVVVSASVVKQETHSVVLRFSVRDTGIGLSQDQLNNLFQAFNQADSSTTRKYGGTGLGLAICKRLVGLMGGAIDVDSEPGEGSVFAFTVTFGNAPELRTETGVALDLRGVPALVIDDNPTSREILVAMLSAFTMKVVGASTLDEGLALLDVGTRDTPFRLIVMDAQLAGTDGLQEAVSIKETLRDRNPPAIIMVGTSALDSWAARSTAMGLEGFITKPVNPSTLSDVVAEALHIQVPRTERKRQQSDAHDAVRRSLRGARVLLAEDNEINQEVACEILEGAGVVVTVAGDGEAAVEKALAKEFDAILMDIQMPKLDGYAATAQLRRVPRLAELPIIAMTANAMNSDRKMALQSGMNDHIAKPIEPDVLMLTLSRWLSPNLVGADAANAVADNVTDSCGSHPELSGIDVSDGLRRVGGNWRLYKRLLLKFRASHLEAISALQQALHDEDLETAERLVHTTKGVAGNLGITKLQNAALELESRIKAGTIDSCTVQLSAFVSISESTLVAISGLDDSTSVLQNEAVVPDVNAAEVKAYAEGMIALLEDSDMAATDQIEAAGNMFGAHVAQQLESHISHYDFDAALVLLRGLVEKHGCDSV